MKAITLRDVPQDVAARIEASAHKSGKSLNRTVIEMLAGAAGAKPMRHHDLDHLFGVWTTDEAARLDAVTASQRTIDEELWS